MESQTQESVAGGSPAEVPNDPGYVIFYVVCVPISSVYNHFSWVTCLCMCVVKFAASSDVNNSNWHGVSYIPHLVHFGRRPEGKVPADSAARCRLFV